jgi:hypothetical protein
MKKLFLLILISFTIFSCEVNEDQAYSYEINPVHQVIMPTEFAKDSTTNITVIYKRPSSCHLFNKFYYESFDFNRTVAIESLIVRQDNCVIDNQTDIELNLPFQPKSLGTYHFKFWTGKNVQGVNQFIEYDVVVDH